MIAPQQEYDVVRCRGDGEHGDHAGGIWREADDVQIAQGGRDTLGGKEFDANDDQTEDRRHDGAVNQQQHHEDDADRDQGHRGQALAALGIRIGDDRGIARHVCLDARWCGCLVDDFPHSGHGLDAGRRALIADEEYLHVGGLAVGALRPGSGQGVTPEVLQTLDVRGVCSQLTDDVVVELVCAVAEFVLSLQNDHRRRVRIELMEYLTDVHHGLERRR